MPKIIASVDGAHYMQKPIIQAFREIFKNTGITVVNKPHANASIVLFSFWGNDKQKMPKAKRVMLCGEPKSTSQVRCNLIVDCKQAPGRRPQNANFVYYPFYVWSFCERFQNKPIELTQKPSPEVIMARKSKFCAFMYRN